MSPTETIRLIDKRIDGVCLELYRRGRRPMYRASEWALAWDLHPDLWSRHQMLGQLRDLAVMERDALIERVYRRNQRHARRALRRSPDFSTGAATSLPM